MSFSWIKKKTSYLAMFGFPNTPKSIDKLNDIKAFPLDFLFFPLNSYFSELI